MMEKRSLVCTICPVGCQIEVCRDGGKIQEVSGNHCKRGQEYAITECIRPVRTVTSTVTVVDGELPVAPVKTDKPIPKHLIPGCMQEINRCRVQAPVKIGDIIVRDVLGSGANIVITGNISMIKDCDI